MPDDAQAADGAAKLAMVASITDLTVDDIEAWILVAVRPDGLYRVASDTCCHTHAAALLAATAADLITDQAAEQHALLN